MRRIAVILVLAGFAAWPGAVHADRVKQGPLIQATDVVAGERTVRVIHSVRRIDALLPPVMSRLDLDFPRGSAVHPDRFPRCGLAELQAKGPGACPARAKVGSGWILGRTVLHPGGVDSRVTILNGEPIGSRRTILMFVRPKLGPSFVNVGFLRGDRGSGVRIDLQFPPPIKTLAGGPPEPSLSDFSLTFGKANFLTASCRSTYRATSHFLHDGALTSSDRASCS